MVPFEFGLAPPEAELETMIKEKPGSARRWATRLLTQLKAGEPFIRTYPFPIQVWRLGDTQLLISLGGEPVVDYDLKFKREFGPQTWVAGYCNDVMTYIPSLRVLKEGGYEGGGAMIYFGLPAAWGPKVEDLIVAAVHEEIEKVRSAPAAGLSSRQTPGADVANTALPNAGSLLR